jgi:hypothetical protein
MYSLLSAEESSRTSRKVLTDCVADKIIGSRINLILTCEPSRLLVAVVVPPSSCQLQYLESDIE